MYLEPAAPGSQGAPSHDIVLISVILIISLSVTILMCGICQWCQRKLVLPCFVDRRVRVTYHRGKNLRDHLCPAVKRMPYGFKPGHMKCGRCQCCKMMEESDTVTIGNRTIRLQFMTSCSTDHVVYVLKCPCSKFYIGKTTRPLRVRLAEHKHCLLKKTKDTPLVSHCQKFHHNFFDLRCTVIDHVPLSERGGDRGSFLLQREQRWIFELNTVEPGGLNSSIDRGVFL